MKKFWSVLAVVFVVTLCGGVAGATEESSPFSERVSPSAEADLLASESAELSPYELARRIDLLGEEIERLKMGEAGTRALTPERGFGPAASKVYSAEGVSIGGYGEAIAQTFKKVRENGAPSGKMNVWDMYRAILYVGYKFNDRVVFNSEIEFEHGNSAIRGEVSAEFAYVDLSVCDQLGFRAGMLLIPVGLTNEQHEPSLFSGVLRPSVAGVIIPTTWRENGIGIFGKVGPVTYRGYLVNSMQAVGDTAVSGFSAEGIRGGRQKGSAAIAEDLAGVFRADIDTPIGLEVGGSVYGGDTSHNATGPDGNRYGAPLTLWEGHLRYQFRGFKLRGLYARSTLGSAAALNADNALTGSASVGEAQWGWFGESSFDVFSFCRTEQALEPFVRFERYDTQDHVPAGFTEDPANRVEELTMGLVYSPVPQVMFKADVRLQKRKDLTGVDQYNVGIGYLF